MGPGFVILIDEIGPVLPTQGSGPDPQRDFGAWFQFCWAGSGLELSAVQLFGMCELLTFPRRAVAPAAHDRLLAWIFVAQVPFADPAGLSLCPGTIRSKLGRSEWLCLGSQNKTQTVFSLIISPHFLQNYKFWAGVIKAAKDGGRSEEVKVSFHLPWRHPSAF